MPSHFELRIKENTLTRALRCATLTLTHTHVLVQRNVCADGQPLYICGGDQSRV